MPKALAVDEYEVLDNGAIIMRHKIRKYEVWAGVGKTFNGQHYYFEETIALARRYAEDEPDDCDEGVECCDPTDTLEDLVAGFWPKGEALKAKRKHAEDVRSGRVWVGRTSF